MQKIRKPYSIIGRRGLLHMIRTARACPVGNICEVGVYQGGSAYYLYRLAMARCVQLHLYDTFSGIPFADDIDRHSVGEFDVGGSALVNITETMPTAVIHPGIFPSTCVDMRPLSFVHVDCDQYQSIRMCITHLYYQLTPGGVMWFDDYDSLPGARLAVDEVFDRDRVILSGIQAYVVKESPAP